MTTPNTTQRVVMFSGGAGSWAAAKRVAETHGTDRLTLLFADTKVEDPDLYRFLGEAAANVGGELVMIADGRTPWEVFRDARFLGNSRVAPCTFALKQKPQDKWLKDNCLPSSTVVYVGIDWTEQHRYDRLKEIRARQGWTYEAPLCEPPYLDRRDVFEWLEREGIRKPRLYSLGFSHNNCGGGCVKAGIGHFSHLYHTLPNVYAEWEDNEEKMRAFLGRTDVAILTEQRNNVARMITLRELRERLDNGYQPDLFEIGGCGCSVEVDQLAEEKEGGEG
jgi:3'-phosphoadenosine 5'-phosphosulfate sulfotransferase (PAPS reductase)/FAD synthetase